MTFDVETVQQYAPGALADLLNRLTADLSAAEAGRDAFATERNILREEVERLEAERKNGVWFYSRRWAESERTQLLQELAEARAEMERLMTRDLEWTSIFPGCCHPDDLAGAVEELREEVERLEAELAWVTETELGLAKQKQNLNCAKLQAVYDALAEHCQTAKHPSPLLLEQLQSLYRLLEDPA